MGSGISFYLQQQHWRRLAAVPAMGQTQSAAGSTGGKSHNAASTLDFTRAWTHPGFPWFEPPASGPGPITNLYRWPGRGPRPPPQRLRCREEQKMLNVIFSLAIPIGIGLILFFVMKMLDYSNDDFKTVMGAFGPLLSVTPIYTILQQRSAKSVITKFGFGEKIGENEFSLHPVAAFLFTLITWIGILLATGAMIGAFIDWAEEASENPIDIAKSYPKLYGSLIIFNGMPLRVIAAAYIGCWIGTRSRRYVLAIIIGAIALASVIGFLVGMKLLSEDMIKEVSENRTPLKQFISQIVPDMVFYMICAALGFWYGQRQRFKYYLAFIMNTVPRDTRQTIVEMAHDEAVKARRTAIPASS
jgi:hypothetical protein